MRRRTYLSTVSTGLLAVAGCVSSGQDNASSPTQTETGTPSPMGPLTANESPTPPEKITSYESLTEKGKELFRTMRNKGSIERPSDKMPSKLWKAEHIHYEGDVYTISKTDTGSNIAEYTLNVDSSGESKADESESVPYANLSKEAKDAFKEALDNGTYTARGDDLPGKLSETRFVKYDVNYYELIVSVGDIRVWKISAIKSK